MDGQIPRIRKTRLPEMRVGCSWAEEEREKRGLRMKTKRPAFQFYPDAWLSSTDITLMTIAEEGAYHRLLCYAWQEEDCGLPDDDRQLAVMRHDLLPRHSRDVLRRVSHIHGVSVRRARRFTACGWDRILGCVGMDSIPASGLVKTSKRSARQKRPGDLRVF